MYDYAKNRRDFDPKEYKIFDAKGKQCVEQLFLFLNKNQKNIIEKFFGSFQDLEIRETENKTYGDLILIFDNTNREICEVEVRRTSNFEGNWLEKGNYSSGINIPMKPNLEISDGIYISLSENEVDTFIEEGHLPKRFIIIETAIIKTCPIVAPPSQNGKAIDKKNNDYKYKIPHNKAYKFEWNEQKEKYLLKK